MAKKAAIFLAAALVFGVGVGAGYSLQERVGQHKKRCEQYALALSIALALEETVYPPEIRQKDRDLIAEGKQRASALIQSPLAPLADSSRYERRWEEWSERFRRKALYAEGCTSPSLAR